MSDHLVTDPSPDCGYTPEEQALMDAVDANPGPNCVTAWQEEPTPPYPPRPQSRVERLAAALAFYADEENYTATLEDAARGRELRVVDDKGHRARSALAGEHYSGAAQDAWDRIVVLEKALREIASCENHVVNMDGDCIGATRRKRVSVGTQPLRYTEVVACPRCFARDALAAGSASPGGAET